MRNEETDIFNHIAPMSQKSIKNKSTLRSGELDKRTDLSVSKISPNNINNISLDANPHNKSAIISTRKRKELTTIKPDQISRNDDSKESSATLPNNPSVQRAFKVGRNHKFETRENKKKSDIKAVSKPKENNEKVQQKLNFGSSKLKQQQRGNTKEEITQPLKKRVDIGQLKKRLIAGSSDEINKHETAELETSTTKPHEIEKISPKINKPLVEEDSDEEEEEEEESEEEESEEEESIKNNAAKSPEVRQTEESKNEIADKLFNSNSLGKILIF